jgi:hypothetical protein
VDLTTSFAVASSSAPVAHTTGGATAKVLGKLDLTLTAGGNLTLKAPTDTASDLKIQSGTPYIGSSGGVQIGGGVSLKAGGDLTLIGGSEPIITGSGFGGASTHGGASGCVSIVGAGCGGSGGVIITAGGRVYHPREVRLPAQGFSTRSARERLGTLQDQSIVVSLDTVLAGAPGSGR